MKGINIVLEGVKNYSVGLGPSREGFKPEPKFYSHVIKPAKQGRG